MSCAFYLYTVEFYHDNEKVTFIQHCKYFILCYRYFE